MSVDDAVIVAVDRPNTDSTTIICPSVSTAELVAFLWPSSSLASATVWAPLEDNEHEHFKNKSCRKREYGKKEIHIKRSPTTIPMVLDRLL